MALRKKASESATAHSMMPKTGENQDALFGHDQDNVAENSYTSNTYTTPTHRGKMTKAHGNQTAFSGEDQSNTYTTPTHRGKMAEAHGNQKAFSGEDQSNTYTTPSHRGKMVETHGNQNAFSGEDQGNTAENDESSKASLNLDWDFPEDETSGLSKTNAEEGHKEEDTTTAAKSMTNTVTSPKASSNKKRSLRNFFRRKGSKESTSSPSSSSAKTAGRRIISAPTLVNASPDAKAILNSATPLTNTPSHAKKVVNYSRPTAPQSSNNESSGSPVGRGRSGSGMRGPNPSYTSPEDDGESLNRSGYSGGEDSVQRAVAVPVVASGRAKQVQVRPPRTINTAPSDIDLGMGIAVTSGTSRMTDEEAMALGVQDAERYMANAMTLQIRPAATSMDDPFVGPAPTQRTALGGSTSTNGERAYAAALSDRHKKGNNTTVRGQLEGYSRR